VAVASAGAICKSALRSRQIATPAPHHSDILQDGHPSCRPSNSVKALEASADIDIDIIKLLRAFSVGAICKSALVAMFCGV